MTKGPTILLGVFALLLLTLLVGKLHESDNRADPTEDAPSHGSPPQTNGPELPTTATTGNPAHDILVALSPANQARALAKSAGEGCVGTQAFFMGIDPKDLTAYWSVRCTNGRSYEVAIAANDTGHSEVADCDVLKAVRISCFAKLDSQ